jgi:cytochrome P450
MAEGARFGLVRALVEARRGVPEGLARLADARSPVVAPRWLPVRVVLDLEVARQVLVTDADSYGRPWLIANIMGEGLGRNMFTATGEDWRKRRRLAAPVFARAHSDELARLMSSTIAEELDGWRPGPVADIQPVLTDLTLRVAARALLGVDVAHDDLGRRLRRHFEAVLGWINHRFLHPAAPPAAVPTPRNRAMLRERAELRAIVRRLIALRRASAERSMDALQLMLDSQGDAGLTDDEIVEESVGWLFAGHETTASTLAWALYHLAAAPELQQRVAAEGDELDAQPSAADADRLAHTGRVVEETLRLYPAGIGLARSTRRPTTLAGERLRRRTIVLIPVYAIQRDGRRWLRPEVFDPDRFTGDAQAHLSFGLGPRQCLGARFATIEARLALAMIASRWTITYDGVGVPRPIITPALRMKGGLPVHLQPRVTVSAVSG